MPQVQCKQCLASINVDPGVDPHTLTWCDCCTIDHHHAEGNEECAADPGHDCWQGPQAGPRHPDCKVCRPVIHYGSATTVLTAR